MRGEVFARWVVFAAWTGTIWALGGDGFSDAQTSRIIRPVLEWLFPTVSADNLDTFHFVIRKSLHAIEYGVWALLLLRALFVTWAIPFVLGCALTLGLGLLLAVADEARQTLSTVRFGAWTDIGLDLAGASVAMVGLRLRRLLMSTRES